MGHKQTAFFFSFPPPLQVTFIHDMQQQKQKNES